MVFERTEHEPEEYDPEEDLHDPESDSLTVPDVSIPEVKTTEADVPSEIQAGFWLIVLTLNAAFLAGSLGILLLAFGYDPTYGVVLLVGGVVLLALAGRRYRTVRPKLRENSLASADADSDTDDASSESGNENGGDDDGDGDGENNDDGGNRDEQSADRHTNTDPTTETQSTRSSESDAPETDQN
ncbi:DUF7322 domain-containing protein [Halomontanus rarus]|uniref:DUF7322 domain-containing protein n=1 Tax=Halomontanus rarus TaxID=3034020 RepID=UPI0023E7B83C|nr:hypothetical protein [Halovivax sp. TS33]